jgi:hypothetical protein
MAARYFRNTGSTSWNVTTNWSLTDGGASVGAIPTASDDVFLTALSGSLVMNSAGVGLSLNCTGFVGTLTMTNTLTISGNVTLGTGMTIAGAAAMLVNAASTLTSNGKTWPSSLTFSAAVTYTFADAWTVSGLFSSTVGVKVLNGSTLTLANGITMTQAISGTTNIVLTGGTWGSAGSIGNNLTINGNVTLGSATAYNTGTLTYTSGTVTTTGNTLTVAGSATFDTTRSGASKITFNNVTFSTAGTATLLSDWWINGTVTNGNVTRTINGFNVYVGGSLTLGNSASIFSGTATIILNGTGTWSASGGIIQNNLTIDTAGTLTVSGAVNYNTGTIRYNAGTLNGSGGTLNCASATTLDLTRSAGSKATFDNVTFSGVVTYTLLSDLYVAVLFTSSGAGVKTINGFTVWLLASLSTTAGSSIGTTKFIFTGTGAGTWTSSGNNWIGNDITIDKTTGILTLGALCAYGTGTLKYISGTVVTTGSTFQFRTATLTLDTNGISFDIVQAAVATGTIVTLLSLLTAATFNTANDGALTFAGTAGFTIASFTIGNPSSPVGAYLFTPGNTYRITSSLNITNVSPGFTRPIQSTVSGTKATLRLDVGATCTVGFMNFTDINASGGRMIYTFNGTVSNCNNIESYEDPIQSIAKSFIA